MILGYSKLKRLDFKTALFQYRKFYPFYSGYLDLANQKSTIKTTSNSEYDLNNHIYMVNDIPPYFKLIPNQENPTLAIIALSQFDGFMANLTGFKNIEEYLNFQMGAKSRAKLRRYKRGLETCFNVKYRFIYGSIDTEEYFFLFKRFKYLIETRFKQRGATHESLKNWATIEKETRSLILDKKASLFVIYDKDKPIDICLNYHYKNVFYNVIRSYDIDYSKFRLGSIDIFVQLDWCFANDHQIFDLGRGDLEYKRLWCNETYKFQQHLIYDKKLFTKKLNANLIAKFIKGKDFLKKKNIHVVYRKIKSIFKKKEKRDTISRPEIRNDVSDFVIDPNHLIDISLEQYAFLRKYTYDFQYSSFETSENIKLYKSKKDSNTYLIQGKTKNQSITLDSNAYK